jgi:hypothetical protein
MKLVDFKDGELVISDEAYHIRSFKALYDMSPSGAINMFGYMYFMYHPGSDYNYIVDGDEKSQTILEALGLLEASNFMEDPLYLSALSAYQKMITTTSSKMIDNNRKRLAKIDVYLDNTELTDDNVAKYTKALSDVNKLSIEISLAEKQVFKDVEEQTTKVRGKTELTIGDRGLNNL